jgi:hypothetical protein
VIALAAERPTSKLGYAVVTKNVGNFRMIPDLHVIPL